MTVQTPPFLRPVLKTPQTVQVEATLKPQFGEQVYCYRHNSVSLRLLIVDEAFRPLSQVERFNLIEPVLQQLPQEVQDDLTFVLLLAPGEERELRYGLRYQEFVDETTSRL